MFHLSHFHRLVRFCWFGLVVGGVCWVSLFVLLTTDQPVRSSYQPMTIIAYLLDCHCRYDERSIVQKKAIWELCLVLLDLLLQWPRVARFCFILMMNTSQGQFEYNIFDTNALTEGRSAWDLPQQPPAKKKHA